MAGLFWFKLGVERGRVDGRQGGDGSGMGPSSARRCRLSPDDVRMARGLGFKPRSLPKIPPSPHQPWKAPVAEWVRDPHGRHRRRSARAGAGRPGHRSSCAPCCDSPFQQCLMSRQRRCRICHKRPPWRYKNCPPGVCKRCYHREIWPDRPAARAERKAAGAVGQDLDDDAWIDRLADLRQDL